MDIEDRYSDAPGRGLVELIGDLSAASGPDGLSLGEVRDRLDERAFGLLILILAIPCLVPGLPGAQLIAIPIVILAAQLMVGAKEPWLPKGILRRRISKAWLDRMADFAAKRMSWMERLSKPRLTGFVTGVGDQVAGLFVILAALTIILPMTNTVPSLAVTLLAAGLLQRDGLFVLAGAALSGAWVTALVSLPIAAFVFGAPWAVDLWDKLFGWVQGMFG